MSGPIANYMGNLPLSTMVQTRVIMDALPDCGGIEIMKGRGQGWHARTGIRSWGRPVAGVLAALARGWAGVVVCGGRGGVVDERHLWVSVRETALVFSEVWLLIGPKPVEERIGGWSLHCVLRFTVLGVSTDNNDKPSDCGEVNGELKRQGSAGSRIEGIAELSELVRQACEKLLDTVAK